MRLNAAMTKEALQTHPNILETKVIIDNTDPDLKTELTEKNGRKILKLTAKDDHLDTLVVLGDGSGAPVSTAFVTNGAIVSPSWKNDGSFDLIGVRGSDLEFKVGPGVQVACAVIASRKSGEDWLRSNANLVVSEEACGNDLCSLWDAMAASYQNSSLDLESEHYLNNAGVGGGQGSEGQGTGGSTGGNTGDNTGDTPGGSDTPGGTTGGGGADPDDPENSED
jgi:hypothetical protein